MDPFDGGAQVVDWTCAVPGAPVGKGTGRSDPRSGHVYTPAKTRSWMTVAARMFRLAWRGAGLEAPLHTSIVDIITWHPRPDKASKGRHAHVDYAYRGKPDGDNVVKAVFDSLVKAGVLLDDASVVDHSLKKRMCPPGDLPRVEVRVRAYDRPAWPRSDE